MARRLRSVPSATLSESDCLSAPRTTQAGSRHHRAAAGGELSLALAETLSLAHCRRAREVRQHTHVITHATPPHLSTSGQHHPSWSRILNRRYRRGPDWAVSSPRVSSGAVAVGGGLALLQGRSSSCRMLGTAPGARHRQPHAPGRMHW